MSQNFTPEPGSTPDLLAQTVASVVRHGLTLAAGYLGAHGLLNTDQQASLVSLGGALALSLVALGWSYVQKRNIKAAGQ